MKLVIIEGAGKKETIEKYLGSGYKVFATKGHIRDLPTYSLGVNVNNNFEPRYSIMDDKKDIVESMKNAAKKADTVFLATDPDREGEAISWHVANILGIDESSPVRIEFNEISKKAVQKALENPRKINANLVDAQQARRVLDRLVGYKLSPVLCKKIQSKLSAGRVQSVTLRLVVEKEREIRAFKPEEYWPFASILTKVGNLDKIKAILSHKDGKKFQITSSEISKSVMRDLDNQKYKVTKVKKSVTKSRPVAPFITSSMQQDALNKLGMSLKQTSLSAQNLYEGVELGNEGKVALVTYIRTDSTRVSPEAINEARNFIAQKYGKDYIPEKPNFYSSKKGAQDAHEAIRPISLERTPDSLKNVLNKNNYKLYKLIYERFLASQMSEATYNSMAVEITAANYAFKVNGKTPLFPGYTAVYSAFNDDKKNDDDDGETSLKLPNLEEGDILNFVEYQTEQKFTKPPARYTEASLVKVMEDKGIGRPATYTPTISVLFARNYVVKDGRFIVPSELGEAVVDMLINYFPDIMNVEFTAKMEEDLDTIEDGGVIWQDVLSKFYEGFEEKIAFASGDSFTLKPVDIQTDVDCDLCGSKMVIKTGRFGKFYACPNYPKCKNTKHMDEKTGKPIEGKQETTQKSDEICDKCGKSMVVKKGRFGDFLACSGYPDCKNIKNLKNDSEEQNLLPCPVCNKPTKMIKTPRSTFYGCTGYPECKFTSSMPLVEGKCPDCGSYLVSKSGKKGKIIACGSKTCKYERKADENNEKS